MSDTFFPWVWFLFDVSSSPSVRYEAAFVLYCVAAGALFPVFLLISGMVHMVRSARFNITVPEAVAKEIKDLAKRLGSSDSKAAALLIIEGCKAMQSQENPFRRK